MKRIFVPTRSTLDWKPLLAQPDRQWKAGFSAMSMAQSWEAAQPGLPTEVAALLATDETGQLADPELVLAIPEYQIALPGGSTATQTDVFALIRTKGGLLAAAVEGKVYEEFGPTVEKRATRADARLAFLHELFELDPAATGTLRYQLFHRTAAAILLAREFGAPNCAMIVQSFSPEHCWFDDFMAFCDALGAAPERGRLAHVGLRGGAVLYIGWASGDQRFRADLSQQAK